MNDQTINILGIAGNIVLIISYIPQIHKIISTKKAEDLSILTWIAILAGDILFLLYAIFKNDSIIASLFTVFTIENLIILYLTFRYGKIEKPALEIRSKKTPEEKIPEHTP